MSDAVLVLNAGSSSIKFGLFDITPTEPALKCKGLLDEHEKAPRIIVTDASGKEVFEKRPAGEGESNDLLTDILAWIENHLAGVRLAAVGHRIVHGGSEFSGAVVITDQNLAALEALIPLAPLHQPRCLASVRRVRTLRPELTQIACFDTAFHHGLMLAASRFAIPRLLEERGIRRYGFHGLSFEYVASQLALSPEWTQKRTVVAHLGNGASLCALHQGKSVDTTMGLTPLDGLVMGTRCGAIDPGVLLYLMQEEKMSADEVQHLLYEKSGLLGVSGVSADMRALLASREIAAREAIELFAFRASAAIAAMANTLGGLDALVFTGGIGEHAVEIRQQICDHLAWLSVRLDAAANAEGRQSITAAHSKVNGLVIATSEETTIARQSRALLNSGTST